MKINKLSRLGAGAAGLVLFLASCAENNVRQEDPVIDPGDPVQADPQVVGPPPSSPPDPADISAAFAAAFAAGVNAMPIDPMPSDLPPVNKTIDPVDGTSAN